MSHEQPAHPKQKFQVERLAFFSDAVFAIAITLLIIEFKVPHVNAQTTVDSVMRDLYELRYNFCALLLSFFLISMYWMWHHLLFKHIHNYNNTIIIANLVVLLPMIFFPFTTSFLSESFSNRAVSQIALRIFMINHIAAGLSIYALYWLATIHHKDFSFVMSSEDRIRFNMKVLFPTLLFIVILTANLLHIANSAFMITLIMLAALRRRAEKYLRRRARERDAAAAIVSAASNSQAAITIPQADHLHS